MIITLIIIIYTRSPFEDSRLFGPSPNLSLFGKDSSFQDYDAVKPSEVQNLRREIGGNLFCSLRVSLASLSEAVAGATRRDLGGV